MLLRDEIELGVTAAATDAQELELLPLINEQMMVCVAQDHPWATRRYLSVKDLEQAPMVVYENGYYIRAELDALFEQAQVKPDLRIQSNFLPLLVRMVKQGLGVTVGLRTMADQEPGLCGIPLSPKVPVNMALAKRRGRRISRANQAFMDWMTQTAKR
jgi:DNA-binding transcriptional LysR family regulator